MSVGIVIIGRNEGERLRRCLDSAAAWATTTVYVDSGSTDGSVELARGRGVEVVVLDMNLPFSAARARNAGFRRLHELRPTLEYVQFIDGDCDLVADWIDGATSFLTAHADVAVACGRRRERHPERSIYNRLCDMEWDTPVGEARACGGDAMMRVSAFAAVDGFRDDLIAGEEPELCVRLRGAGWRIWRLDAEMTLHDAAMTRFGQWWRRTLRGGYAFAAGAALHGAPPERHWVRESRRAWAWGLALPLVIVAAAASVSLRVALLLALVYPAQVLRLALTGGRSPRDNGLRAVFLVLGKFPEMLGQLKYWLGRLGSGGPTLIEYK